MSMVPGNKGTAPAHNVCLAGPRPIDAPSTQRVCQCCCCRCCMCWRGICLACVRTGWPHLLFSLAACNPEARENARAPPQTAQTAQGHIYAVVKNCGLQNSLFVFILERIACLRALKFSLVFGTSSVNF